MAAVVVVLAVDCPIGAANPFPWRGGSVADDTDHTVFRDGLTAATADAITFGMGRVNVSTRPTGPRLRNEPSQRLTASTSVHVLDDRGIFTGNQYGLTTCERPLGNLRCGQFRIRFDIDRTEIFSPEQLSRAGCHELGHTIGLEHPDAGSPYTVTCMDTSSVPNGQNLNVHDIAHVRGYYDYANQVPAGYLDAVTPIPGGTAYVGWAHDLDNPDSMLAIHVYGNGQFLTAQSANLNRYRPDVANVFPGDGHFHGFNIGIVSQFQGWNICLYAINVDPFGTHVPNANALIGCATATG